GGSRDPPRRSLRAHAPRMPAYRRKRRAAAGAWSGGLPLALLELRPHAVLLELGKEIDEHLALQVIHLVLDARREHARCVERETRAVAIEGRHGDAFGALDVVVDARDRKTALLVHGEPFAARDFRIDEDTQVAAILAHVDDDDLLVHVDLRGG